MYRKCELDISCTFPVPIIHTVQVIRPATFPDVQKLSHFLYIFCTYHTYSTGHSTWISRCAEIVTFSVHFLYLSYIQYRSFDLEHFLICRNCHIFCTFPVPIIHTCSPVIRPGAFRDVHNLSHVLYNFCMNPILNQCRSQGTVSDE